MSRGQEIFAEKRFIAKICLTGDNTIYVNLLTYHGVADPETINAKNYPDIRGMYKAAREFIEEEAAPTWAKNVNDAKAMFNQKLIDISSKPWIPLAVLIDDNSTTYINLSTVTSIEFKEEYKDTLPATEKEKEMCRNFMQTQSHIYSMQEYQSILSAINK